MRNCIFTKLDIDTHFKFITDGAEFKFTGYDTCLKYINFILKKRKQFDSKKVMNKY